ncbi:TolC family protein [Candidatus Aerophobetes bacterium]|nr:TolC family protein [Candidatus Aerophobetes bacterium]
MGKKIIFGILLSFSLQGACLATEPVILSLQESIQRALKYNLDVQLARKEMEKVELEVKKEKATFEPQIDLKGYLQWEGEYSFLEYTPQVNFNATFSTLWGMDASLNVTGEKEEDESMESAVSFTLTQKILPASYLDPSYLSLRKSLLSLDKEKMVFEEKIEDIKLTVITSFYQVLSQQKECELKKLSLEQARENLNIVKDKFKKGMASKIDVMDAEIGLIEAEEEFYQAESNLLQSIVEFKELLGIKEDEEIMLEDKTSIEEHLLKMELEDMVKKALENNRQINQKLLAIDMCKLDLLTSKSELSCSLNLLAGYTYNQLGQKEENYRVGMYVEIPIFDGKRSETEIQIIQKELEKEKLELERLKQELSAEVRDNFYELKRLEKRIISLKLSQEKQKEALEIAKKMFLQGALTSREVREREISLIQAEIDYIEALANYEVAKAELLKNMGEGI